jgi:hypothetical protein
MTLWQGILVVIACCIVAITAGFFLGMSFSKKWPVRFFRGRKQAATGNETSRSRVRFNPLARFKKPVTSPATAEKTWVIAELSSKIQAKRDMGNTMQLGSEAQHPVIKEEIAYEEAAGEAKRMDEEARQKRKAEEKAREEAEKLTRRIDKQKAAQLKREAKEARQKSEAEEKARKEAEKIANRKAKQEAKEAAEQAKYEAIEKIEREARETAENERLQASPAEAERLAREKAEREAREKAQREAWDRAQREAWERTQRMRREAAEQLAREKAAQEAKAASAPAGQTAAAAGPTQEAGKSSRVLGEPYLAETRANLKIATTPWMGKPLPFQTTTMTNNPSIPTDLVEAYTDMAMANNIVWLVTDLGTSSKDLENSYLNLCAKIAERLTKVLQSNDN